MSVLGVLGHGADGDRAERGVGSDARGAFGNAGATYNLAGDQQTRL